MTNYQRFIRQLDDFIDRYYRNEIFKGALRLAAILLLLFLVLTTIEYFTFFSSFWRTILFWVYTSTGVVLLFYYVVIAILRRYGIYGRMSHKEAATYLSASYPDLDDKLCNVLELHDIGGQTSLLVEAAIEQISAQFTSYRFAKVIKNRSLLKYVRFLLVPVLLVFCASIFFPNIILKSSNRLLHYNKEFEREFPFCITLKDSVLRVPYEGDFTVHIKVEGEILPSQIQIVYDDKSVGCVCLNPNSFTYTFSKLRSDRIFILRSGAYSSKAYKIEVIPHPLIRYMKMEMDYPSYTGLADQKIDNTLDAQVPYGTVLRWSIDVDNAKDMKVIGAIHPNIKTVATPKGNNFLFSALCSESFEYAIIPIADSLSKSDTLRYKIDVIQDRYPRIDIRELEDSSNIAYKTMVGDIADDYGFHSLIFRVKKTDKQGKEIVVWRDTLLLSKIGSNKKQNSLVELEKERNSARFIYAVNPDNWGLSAGDEVSYDFELRDNDPYFPYKSSFSNSFIYKKLGEEEKMQLWQENKERMAAALKSGSTKNKEFDKNYQSLTSSLIESSKWNWEERKKVENMIAEQQKRLQEYKKAAEDLKKNAKEENEWNEYSPELKEKEKILEELMKSLWDEKSLKKLEEIEKLLEENAPKEKILEGLEQWKEEQRDLAKDWERNKEMYKQLEFEKGLEKVIDDLKKMRSEQDKLREDLKNNSSEKAMEKQEELNRRYEETQKMIEGVDKQNKELNKPTSFKVPENMLENIKSEMQQAADNLGKKGQEKAAGENQQKASDGMKSLSENLEQQQESIEEENEAEDAEFIRVLLKEIIKISFDEEKLMDLLQQIKVSDSRYADVIRRQNQLVKDVSVIADSINSIAVRQPSVASVTNFEIKEMLSQSRSVLSELLAMNDVLYRHYQVQNQRALAAQQRTMISLNNLSLLLSESLDKMQMSMSMKSKGGSSKSKGKPQASCSNPGEMKDGKKSAKQEGKPSNSNGKGQSLKEQQESLNKGLDALKKAMDGKAARSEDFMRAAAQQEMIRRALQKQLDDIKKQGGKAAGDLNNVLGDMEQTERDLVNKIINPQTMLRQQNIQTRLLEAEKAEMQREQEEKRESVEGKSFEPKNIDELNLLDKDKKANREGLRETMPNLNLYYKQKVEEYFFK